MKIAIVTSHINRSTQWLWFSEELQKRNIEHIHIIINEKRPILADDLANINIPVYYLKHVNFFSFFRNFFRIIKLFKKHQIDLIHTELPYGNLMGQLVGFTMGIKKRIATCENSTWAFDFQNRKQYLIDRFTYFLAKKVVVLTPASYNFVLKHYKMKKDKLLIIPHSLKTEDYMHVSTERVEALKKEIGIKEGQLIIGMVSRFEFWKGHRYAIEAMKNLVKDYKNLRLLIFGSSGESFKNVIDMIKKAGLEDYVEYKGFVRDNIALFKTFDIHLHIPINSEVETFGINMMEGMISGCSQIMTQSGIGLYTAVHEKNCLVVEYQSAKSIEAAVIRMIMDPDLRIRLGKQARIDAMQQFHYPEKVDRHLALYHSMQ